jgi:hypothetical protein
MLRSDRQPLEDTAPPRILLVSPYRAHSRLVSLLLRDREPKKEILAGTTHSFQGSEAPVVILDLVNGEPHRRAGMFDAAYNEEHQRLLNVAVTRAQRRLVVVGDFDFIARAANRHAFLRQFVEYLLKHFPGVNASDIGGANLAASALRLEAFKTGTLTDADYLVVSERDYFSVLFTDLSAAQKEVVIFSPYLTTARLSALEPSLRAATARGVRVVVFTRLPDERTRTEAAEAAVIESTLGDWGVQVLHKRSMHEKVVFIDDQVVWVGSLNTLSQGASQELMIRWRNAGLAADVRKQLRLTEILDTYNHGDGSCPICGSELTPAEGQRGAYWRCVGGDYTRNLEAVPPKDGRIVCSNCSAPVRFGNWGEGYAWRCEVNPRHHQRVFPSHLRLPKMRELVPAKAQRDLERENGGTETQPRLI